MRSIAGSLEGQHTVLAEERRGCEAVRLFLVAPLALVDEVAELDGLARLERNAVCFAFLRGVMGHSVTGHWSLTKPLMTHD